MKNYFRLTISFALLLATAIGCFNWLVNPYLVFNSPVFKGVNEFVTENYYKQLLFKPYQLRQLQPRSVIIGASRAGIAFDPGKLPPPAYNLAVGGASAYINYRLLQEALANETPPEFVILETPFFAFNACDPNNRPGHDPELEQRLRIDANGKPNLLQPAYAARDTLSSLLSWETTRASLRTLNKQTKLAARKRSSFIQKRDGQWLQQAPANLSSYRQFKNSWKKFLDNEWFPAPEHRFNLQDKNGNSPLEYYRKSLRLLYGKQIRTDIVIAPVHASLLLALQEANLWNTFESWEAAVIRINEEEAARAGQTAFTIHDYATINEYTTEEISEEKPATQMQWFYDASHSTPVLGDKVLADILTGGAPTAMASPKLSAFANERRQKLGHYAETHPQQIDSIRQQLTEAPLPY